MSISNTSLTTHPSSGFAPFKSLAALRADIGSETPDSPSAARWKKLKLPSSSPLQSASPYGVPKGLRRLMDAHTPSPAVFTPMPARSPEPMDEGDFDSFSNKRRLSRGEPASPGYASPISFEDSTSGSPVSFLAFPALSLGSRSDSRSSSRSLSVNIEEASPLQSPTSKKKIYDLDRKKAITHTPLSAAQTQLIDKTIGLLRAPIVQIRPPISHLVRGSYIISEYREMSLDAIKTLSENLPSSNLNPLSDAPLHVISDFLKEPAVLAKPLDEVRGEENCRRKSRNNPPSKLGIPPKHEMVHEVMWDILLAAFASQTPVTAVEGRVNANCFFFMNQEALGEEIWMNKNCSLQRFFPEHISLEKIKKEQLQEYIDLFPKAQLESIFMWDLLLLNTDRHAGNLLTAKDGREILPIDNSLFLPAELASSAKLFWMYFPSAYVPFSPDAVDKIRALDVRTVQHKIKEIYPKYAQANLDILEITGTLLKTGTQNGLTPFQLGFLLSEKNEFNPSILRIYYDQIYTDPLLSEVGKSIKMQELITKAIAFLKMNSGEIEQAVRKEIPPVAGDFASLETYTKALMDALYAKFKADFHYNLS